MHTREVSDEVIDIYRSQLKGWSRLVPSNQPEIMDGEIEQTVAKRIFTDLENFSKIVGVKRKVITDINNLLADVTTEGKTIRILELCCGNGWLARSLARYYHRVGYDVEVVGLDISDQVITMADQGSDEDGLRFVVGDALDMEFAANEFDVVLNVQSLHHFSAGDSVKLLSEMSRVGHHVYVYDIRRTTLGFLAMHLFRPFASREFVHDASLSHRRAFSIEEAKFLNALARTSLDIKKVMGVGMTLSK